MGRTGQLGANTYIVATGKIAEKPISASALL
jgi:hypothetical protein